MKAVGIACWLMAMVISVSLSISMFKLLVKDKNEIAIHADQATGCQYLVSSSGGITPRFDRVGGHICNEVTHEQK